MKKLYSSLLITLFVTGLFSCKSTTPQRVLQDDLRSQLPPQLQTQDLPSVSSPSRNIKKVKVALFLPFSGKNKELSWHLFNSVTMSMFDNDADHNIELVLIDSKDDPKEIEQAFKEVIARNIKVVIGPIFSSSIDAIEKDARSHGITAISLSNNQLLADKTNDKGGVFIAGMLPEAQIDRIVDYAIEHGKSNFAIIAPNNQYGAAVTNIFKRVVKIRDANFITSEFYSGTSDKNIDRSVDRAINSFSIPSELKREQGKDKDLVIQDSDRIYPDVIMIPESGKVLSKIVASIKAQNKEERKIQLVGTSQWDDISTLNDRNLFGAWFAAPDNQRFRTFENSYYKFFGKFPPRISSVAYDSLAAVADVIRATGGQDPKLKDFVNYNNPVKNGFDGIDGTFRFLPNGLIQRNLAVLQVDNGRFTTIANPVAGFLEYR